MRRCNAPAVFLQPRELILTGIAAALMVSVSLAADPFIKPPYPPESFKPFDNRLSPFDVGSRAQLFIDQVVVAQTQHIWFTQHQGRKHSANPLIRADQPWEGWQVQMYGSAFYDEQEKLFKLWYGISPDPAAGYFDDEQGILAYATSPDGVQWQKPLVGTIPSKNGKPHNVVARIECASVIKDMSDPDPSQRYKCTGWVLGPNYMSFVSPDGLHWNPCSKSAICLGQDVLQTFYDPLHKLWVALAKKGTWTRGHGRRCFGTTVSPDFQQWSPLYLNWIPDTRDDASSLARLEKVRNVLDRPDDPRRVRTEFYGIGAYPAESCTVAFPWILTINNDARWGNQDGTQEIQLGVSRDLVTWERPFRTPVIATGDCSTWDGSYQSTASSAFRYGDEIRLYYSGANYTHGAPCLGKEKFDDGTSTGRRTKFNGSIGLVTWPLDRFVSADGPAQGGVLKTVPIRFQGRRLELNAATKNTGRITVSLCDTLGKPLSGYETSQPFQGDSLRHTVSFAGKTDVSSLAGKPVVLQIQIKDAQLFSFAFRE